MVPDESGVPPYRVLDGLGQGAYGVVLEVKHVATSRHFAMKVMTKDILKSERHIELFRRELVIMERVKKVPSPFITRFVECFETDHVIMVVMDLLCGGNLLFHMQRRATGHAPGTFTEDETRVILAELTLALKHVHKMGFIHRDVKVENVMLDSEGHVKLIDFGLACEFSGKATKLIRAGSLAYMAPEYIADDTGGRHTDWWAVGVLAYAMLTGMCPWSSLTDADVLLYEITNLPVNPPESIPSPARHFISSLLQKDFNLRLGTHSDRELRDSPFFGPICWTSTAQSTSRPAFLPTPNECVDPQESITAMGLYSEILERSCGATTPAGFSLGLRAAASPPPLQS